VTSPFLTELREDLSESEYQLLVSCNINTADDLYSFTMTFPALVDQGIDLAKLSNVGAKLGSGAVVKVGRSIQVKGTPPQFPFGVSHAPPGVLSKGSSVPPPSGSGAPLKKLRALDYRLPNWPVRHQGDRGTCVAHALAALREYATGGSSFSPQFLFWATKTHGHDPFPDDDGTRLEYARKALADHGTCEEHHWPYDGKEQLGNVTHACSGTPSDAMKANALRFKQPSAFLRTKHKGNAERLYDELERAKAPIAISLPVFADQGSQLFTNWNSANALVGGSIVDPPENAVVVGAHAVCVTGFVLDPNELLGGYFVFRNSWGVGWAHTPPTPRDPGYGQVSATYVDKFVWEICRLA
jgi:hypothetical protein